MNQSQSPDVNPTDVSPTSNPVVNTTSNPVVNTTSNPVVNTTTEPDVNLTKGPVNLTKEPADVVPTSFPVGEPTKELTVNPNQLQIGTLENFPGLPDGCSLVEFLEIRFSEMKEFFDKKLSENKATSSSKEEEAKEGNNLYSEMRHSCKCCV